jgi:fructose-bisphosphate aldolase class II
VHGVYKPGRVKLKPTILRDGQDALEKAYGPEGRFFLVFHGGSGSSLDDIRKAVDYGVVKMNIDTDTQYAFTRPIVDHIFKNYDGVLKVDGEVGKKKACSDFGLGADAGLNGFGFRMGFALRCIRACSSSRDSRAPLPLGQITGSSKPPVYGPLLNWRKTR